MVTGKIFWFHWFKNTKETKLDSIWYKGLYLKLLHTGVRGKLYTIIEAI